MNNPATLSADALGDVADGYPKTISLSGQDVEIRVLGTEDREPVLAFAQALPEQDLLFLRLDITEPDIVDAWLANISNGATFSLSAYADGDFVGYATVERNPARWTRRVGEIRVNVAPSLRSQGLGRSLTSQNIRHRPGLGLEEAGGAHDPRPSRCPSGVQAARVRPRSAAGGPCGRPPRQRPRPDHHVLRRGRPLRAHGRSAVGSAPNATG